MPSPTNAMLMKNTTQNCVCFLATSLNAPIFSSALADLIIDYEPGQDDLLNWFVKIFADETPGVEEKEFDRFKVKVRQNLKKSSNLMTNITTERRSPITLGRLESIGAFRTTLEAFGFEDWKSCIEGKNMFEKIINMAYENAMAVLSLRNAIKTSAKMHANSPMQFKVKRS